MDKNTESILLHTYSPEELDRLKQIETYAKNRGILCGLLVALGVGGGFAYKKHRRVQVSSYYAGVASLLSGLITSQLGTHYLFIRGSDQIRFERRIKAAMKYEESKRKGYHVKTGESHS